MLHLLASLVQFAIQASDPNWSCALVHRDPYIAGTYYLYCAQRVADDVELITVGRFISDEGAL